MKYYKAEHYPLPNWTTYYAVLGNCFLCWGTYYGYWCRCPFSNSWSDYTSTATEAVFEEVSPLEVLVVCGPINEQQVIVTFRCGVKNIYKTRDI